MTEATADYPFSEIELKWQQEWEKQQLFKAEIVPQREKFYALVEFPYPSGAGLHVGHQRSYTAMDVIARYQRMCGKNVLFPIGFDAFGLPTENYAIKTGIAPQQATTENIQRFIGQLKRMGFSFDWDRCINSSDPSYYRWTQWLFLQFVKHDLAYKDSITINWCPACKTGLANEEVIEGHCERCGAAVTKKKKSQWMLRITKYADKLIDNLAQVNFIEQAKQQQINWIGRSEGAELQFSVADAAGHVLPDAQLTIFTTRPDTIYGVTYVVIAPEHRLIEQYADLITNIGEVRAYVQTSLQKSTIDRNIAGATEKTGLPLNGLRAVNPFSGETILLFTADYVLADYGTGAVMAVPAHDERDYAFAKLHQLPMHSVIRGGDLEQGAFTGEGEHYDSEMLNGLDNQTAIQTAIQYAEAHHCGKRKLNYRLRDWVFSRQRYWGEPIPMVHCEQCGWVPLPESELPLVLPKIDDYLPTDEGDSPLAKAEEWVHTTCPHCHGPALRETDTMPNWAGSSWYFLRYTDPHNDQEFAARSAMDYWLPVDWYEGGMEHTTLHLLYSRFWHEFLHDCGLVRDPEPYAKRTSHGMILASDGQKMSKSKGNVVNPDEIIKQYGADTLRVYEMFIGPYDQATFWNPNSLAGSHRFLQKVYRLLEKASATATVTEADLHILHQTIKDVSERIMEMRFNTCVSALMILANYLQDLPVIPVELLLEFVKILSPFAPHLAEELWHQLGQTGFVVQQSWPIYDSSKTVKTQTTVVLQINGKRRGELNLPVGSTEAEVYQAMCEDPKLSKYFANITVRKRIYLQDKLLNIVCSGQ